MSRDKGGQIIWLASYPKSGNTWLRCLLEAYRCNGNLDINDIRICLSDGSLTPLQTVAPMPMQDNAVLQRMLRPAALLHLIAFSRDPCFVKTHWANLTVPGFHSYIPPQLTRKAIYVVRDPRQVAISLSMWLNYPIDKIISNMNNPAHYLGGRQQNAISILSTWSAHAASWATEEAFPVHVMMYEDMLADTEKALEECIDFLGWKKDKRRIKRAVKAASMKALQETEEAAGFTENVSTGQERFFHAGGTRWQDELGPKWIKQIEDDHREVMIQLGYLEKKPVELTAVS
jgi:hypothetical protein